MPGFMQNKWDKFVRWLIFTNSNIGYCDLPNNEYSNNQWEHSFLALNKNDTHIPKVINFFAKKHCLFSRGSICFQRLDEVSISSCITKANSISKLSSLVFQWVISRVIMENLKESSVICISTTRQTRCRSQLLILKSFREIHLLQFWIRQQILIGFHHQTLPLVNG